MNYSNVIVFLAQIACRKFGSTDGTFNSASFSQAVSETIGLPLLDGEVVALILSARTEITRLPGGAHWRVLTPEEKRQVGANDIHVYPGGKKTVVVGLGVRDPARGWIAH